MRRTKYTGRKTVKFKISKAKAKQAVLAKQHLILVIVIIVMQSGRNKVKSPEAGEAVTAEAEISEKGATSDEIQALKVSIFTAIPTISL